MIEQLHLPGIPPAERSQWVSLDAPNEGSPMARREGESIYRRVSTQMHVDAKIRKLTKPPPNGKSLWEALLFGEQVDIVPGLFRIGEAAFAEQLDWPLKGFRAAWGELEAAGLPVFADWNARLVWVVNALRHNMPGSPNVILHWRDCWNDRLPDCNLKEQAHAHMEATFEAMGEAWGKAFAKATAKALPNAFAKGFVEPVSSKQLAVSSSKHVVSSVLGESEGTVPACESVDNSPPAKPNPLSNSLNPPPVNNAAPEGEGEETHIGATVQAAMEAQRKRAST